MKRGEEKKRSEQEREETVKQSNRGESERASESNCTVHSEVVKIHKAESAREKKTNESIYLAFN